jgi:type I restriction enzyme S subunit
MTSGLRLKHVASVNAGQSPPSPEVTPFDGQGLPFLQGNAEFGAQHPLAVHRCDSAPRIADEGALLVSVRAPVGAVNLADRQYGIGRGLAAIIPRSIHPRYAYWLLLNSAEWLNSIATGSTFTAISGGDLGDVSVPVSNEPAQRAIADYLDRETAQIDALIAKNEELITLLTERRAAELELAVAPRKLPKTWDSVQIRRLGPKSQSGVSVNGLSVPAEGDEVGVLKTGAVSKGFFDPAENKRVVAEDLGRVAAPVRGGSLIVNRANTPELVGSAALVVESHPTLYLSDKLWQVSFESANATYVHYWTRTDAYRSQLRGLSVGASLSMQNLSYGDFLSVRISVPPMREQAELVARLDQVTREIDRAIDAARRGTDLARERRAALIAAAVTGKIDVRVRL